MQIIGLALLGFIVWLGFADRGSGQTISAFDPHALTMVLVGSLSAVLVSSNHTTALRTFAFLREIIPGLRRYSRQTIEMEEQRDQVYAMWREGKRSNALALAEKSPFPAIHSMVDLILNRAGHESSAKAYLEMRHDVISHFQPAILNWEMLSKLGPAFGMVGTITGMITMFKNMSADNLNIGASMSLALLATLYGVAFGSGVAGPIGHYLNGLLDERLGFLERCEKSVNELVARDGEVAYAAARKIS